MRYLYGVEVGTNSFSGLQRVDGPGGSRDG